MKRLYGFEQLDKKEITELKIEARFFRHVKTIPVSGEETEILLPGEIEYRIERDRRRYGIPLPAAVYGELERIGNETNRRIDDD